MRIVLVCLGLFGALGLADAKDFPRGRLSDAAKPLAYRLDLTVVPDQERFSGHAEIDVDLKSQTTSLFLHGRKLNVKTVTATSGGNKVKATYSELDKLGTARLDFERAIAAGKVTLSFDYDAAFGDGPSGLYRLKVADEWYSWTQFESIDARAAFPSFDEPEHKTPFTVSLTTKPGFLALSNAPESGAPVKIGNLVKHSFVATKPLPTYLIAFVVGPFATVQGSVPPTPQRKEPLPIRIVATKNQAGRLDYALAETPRIVQLLESYFDHGFPYPKLDQIASPVMGGAMENAGADIYGDNILLLDKGAATRQKQVFGMVVSHELAHQWFGDYVTPAWWDDIWLNESFANWMGFRIGNEWRPELNIGVNAIEEALRAMSVDALKVGRPVRQPIVTNSDIDSAFDPITYGKGGQVIAMVAAYLGDEKFRDGVRLHMSRHPHGTATSDEFFKALADAAKDPRILKALQSFVNQQGVPVIDLSRTDAGFSATQERYTVLGTPAYDQTWIIPFCVRRSQTSSCTLVDRKTQPIVANGTGPLIPNAGGRGYYRYNLSAADWDALIAVGAQLPAGEGIAASDSLWSQFPVGHVTATQLITAAEKFIDNPDSNVAVYGGLRLSGWYDRGLVPHEVAAEYRHVMNAIYGHKLAALRFDPAAGAHAKDSPDRQKLRQALVKLVAGDARDTATRQALKSAAQKYLAGNVNALDQAFYFSALQVRVEDGDLAVSKDLFARMVDARDELFRDAALSAIAVSGRTEDARWLIAQFGEPRLRSTEKIQLLGGLLEKGETRDLAFDWLKQNYDAFAKDAGIFASTMIPSLPSDYCSADKAKEIDQVLRSKVREAGRGELSFDRMLENIQTCGSIKQKKSAEIGAALRQRAAKL